MPLLLNEETLMPCQFTLVTKCGAPYAQTIYPMTKCGGPYAISRNLETSNTLWLKSLFTKRGTPDLQTLETIE